MLAWSKFNMLGLITIDLNVELSTVGIALPLVTYCGFGDDFAKFVKIHKNWYSWSITT